MLSEELGLEEFLEDRQGRPCSGSSQHKKKIRKVEVSHIPLVPKGESTESLENERNALMSEIKKRDNEVVIKKKKKMEKTFSHRRLEIV